MLPPVTVLVETSPPSSSVAGRGPCPSSRCARSRVSAPGKARRCRPLRGHQAAQCANASAGMIMRAQRCSNATSGPTDPSLRAHWLPSLPLRHPMRIAAARLRGPPRAMGGGVRNAQRIVVIALTRRRLLGAGALVVAFLPVRGGRWARSGEESPPCPATSTSSLCRFVDPQSNAGGQIPCSRARRNSRPGADDVSEVQVAGGRACCCRRPAELVTRPIHRAHAR